MRTLRSKGFLFIGAALSAILFAGGVSGDIRFAESFDSKLYCDKSNTTALWDTIAGELRLHPFVLDIVGSCASAGYASSVAIAGNYAYVAAGSGGLLVVDITDSANPVVVGTCDTPGTASDWNGTSDHGGKAASGIYFYRITAGSFTQTKKMVLLR